MINLGQLSNYITINDNTQTLLNVAMARINDVLGYDLVLLPSEMTQF